jgi:hypothetical protein
MLLLPDFQLTPAADKSYDEERAVQLYSIMGAALSVALFALDIPVLQPLVVPHQGLLGP